MLHRTVWDAPSASSKKEVSFIVGEGVENVTSNLYGTRRPPARKGS